MHKHGVPKWLLKFITATRCCRTLQRLLLTLVCGVHYCDTNTLCDKIYWGE